MAASANALGRVDEGIRALDAGVSDGVTPSDWRDLINLSTVDPRSATLCPLAQIFGAHTYYDAKADLGIDRHGAHYGFSPSKNVTNEDLIAAWRERLGTGTEASRLAPPISVTRTTTVSVKGVTLTLTEDEVDTLIDALSQ